jgi:hypothetical protein
MVPTSIALAVLMPGGAVSVAPRAIQDYDQAIKLDPKDADAIKNRAMAIARKNNR